MNASITRLQTYRTDIRRRVHNVEIDEGLAARVNRTMASIKDYIKSSKDYSSKLKIANTKDEANLAVIKQRSSAFILENINQNLDEIETPKTLLLLTIKPSNK